MPKPVAKRFTAWSFSRYWDYQQCPYRASLKHLFKMPEPPNPAMARGTAIHGMAAEVVEGLRTEIPPELESFQEELEMVRELRAKETEKQLALTSHWLLTEWFAPSAWVRVIMDLLFALPGELHIVDFKTGRKQPYHTQQLSLYAGTAMSLYPEATKVVSELWYFDQGEVEVQEYDVSEHAAIKETWNERTLEMMSDTRFPATPGEHCRWCSFSKASGGPCVY